MVDIHFRISEMKQASQNGTNKQSQDKCCDLQIACILNKLSIVCLIQDVSH